MTYSDRQITGRLLYGSLLFAFLAVGLAFLISVFFGPERVTQVLLIAFLILLIGRVLLMISDKLFGWPISRYPAVDDTDG